MEQKRRGEGTESSEGVGEACANEYLFVLAKWTANASQVLQKSRVWKERSEDILRIYTGRGEERKHRVNYRARDGKNREMERACVQAQRGPGGEAR